MRVEYEFDKKAGRIELLIRLPYILVLLIVRLIFRLVAQLIFVAQLFLILFTGKRSYALSKVTAGYISYDARSMAYLFLATDKRPRLFENGTIYSHIKIRRVGIQDIKKINHVVKTKVKEEITKSKERMKIRREKIKITKQERAEKRKAKSNLTKKKSEKPKRKKI